MDQKMAVSFSPVNDSNIESGVIVSPSVMRGEYKSYGDKYERSNEDIRRIEHLIKLFKACRKAGAYEMVVFNKKYKSKRRRYEGGRSSALSKDNKPKSKKGK